jgi:hypothetical protein
MGNMTLALDEKLKREMKKFPEINWSEVARIAIRRKILLLSELDDLLKDSEITKEDSIVLSRKLKRAVRKKLEK